MKVEKSASPPSSCMAASMAPIEYGKGLYTYAP